MRNLKKFLAMALTMLMVAACFAGVTSNATFDDVYDHVEAIETLDALGIAKGGDNGNFLPDELVQRYQAVLFFTRAMTGDVNSAVYEDANAYNYTTFADCDNYYPAAISYAVNSGIIAGYPDGSFGPTDGIEYQQMLTIAARALGYTITAAEYPYKAIQLANDLGLTADLDDVESYDAVLTRAQTAQVIYNFLSATKADGTTYAKTAFNLTNETYVLTATTDRNLGDTFKIAATGYVGMSVLNANGTIGKTYYVKEADVLTKDEISVKNEMLGYSFKILATEDLSTVYASTANTVTLFESDAIGHNSSGQLVLDNTAYTLVSSFTGNLWNTDKKNTNNNEMILYSWNEAATAGANTLFLYDANWNIINNDGEIVLYYLGNNANGGTIGGLSSTLGTGYTSTIAPSYLNYGKLVSGTPGVDAVYAAATYDDVANAITVVNNGASGSYGVINRTNFVYSSTWSATTASGNPSGYGLGTDAKSVVRYGKQYDEVYAIDDNGDGVYDRAIYKAFNFGKIEKSYVYCDTCYAYKNVLRISDGNGYTVFSSGNDLHWSAINWEGLGETTGWCIYSLNSYSSGHKGNVTIDVKKTFDVKTGFVTGFSRLDASDNATIQIDGVNYAFGTYKGNNVRLYGPITSVKDNEYFANLYGHYINYVIDDINNVVYYVSATESGRQLFVFEELRAITTDGLLKVSGFFENGSNTTIDTYDIEFVNDVKATTWVATNGTSALKAAQGKVFVLAKNLNGTYSLYFTNINDSTVEIANGGKLHETFSVVDVNGNYGWGFGTSLSVTTLPTGNVYTSSTLSFLNNYLYVDGNITNSYTNYKLATNDKTVWVFVGTDKQTGAITSVDYAVGNTTITADIAYNGFVIVREGDNNNGTKNIRFIYVYGATNASTFLAGNGSETIYFFDSYRTRISYTGNSLYGIETQYKYLFNLKTGSYDDSVTFYNILGVAGKYYLVRHNTQSTLANTATTIDVTERMTRGEILGYVAGSNGAVYAEIGLVDNDGNAIAGSVKKYIAKNATLGIYAIEGSQVLKKNSSTIYNYGTKGYEAYTLFGEGFQAAVNAANKRVLVAFWNDAIALDDTYEILSTPSFIVDAITTEDEDFNKFDVYKVAETPAVALTATATFDANGSATFEATLANYTGTDVKYYWSWDRTNYTENEAKFTLTKDEIGANTTAWVYATDKDGNQIAGPVEVTMIAYVQTPTSITMKKSNSYNGDYITELPAAEITLSKDGTYHWGKGIDFFLQFVVNDENNLPIDGVTFTYNVTAPSLETEKYGTIQLWGTDGVDSHWVTTEFSYEVQDDSQYIEIHHAINDFTIEVTYTTPSGVTKTTEWNIEIEMKDIDGLVH